jgi:UPF0755 protein
MFRPKIVIIATLSLALIVAGALLRSYQVFLIRPIAIDAGGATLLLERGTSYRGLVQQLNDRGFSDGGWQWRFLGWLDDNARALKAGEYRLQSSLTPPRLLAKLASGEVIQYSLTIVEGWTFSELRHTVMENPVLQQTLAAAEPGMIMRAIGQDEVQAEGWFLPETYHFPRGTSDLEFYARAHQAMRTALDDAWQAKALGLPFEHPYEALILASIIEKETGLAIERDLIGGVFVRRLQTGMRLQTDPSVIYGLGAAFDGNLRRRDLRTDTPYNTYTRSGLPPTPISLPGRAALEAALHPGQGSALYFVARGDGSHQFSESLEQHERAVDRYQRGIQ